MTVLDDREKVARNVYGAWMKRLWFGWSVVLVVGLSGCAAGRSTWFLLEANKAWKDARDAGAADLSSYEYDKATLYRDKAFEEWGYCRYGDAEDLFKEVTTLARTAESVSLHGEEERELMEELEQGAEDLPDDFEFEDDEWLD